MPISSKIIGILGTAKNTGKTTTFNFLLEWANKENIGVGLTSIGYDGEDIDNITGLPKPRIFIQKGNIIATAEQCLSSTAAKLETIEKTPILTPLGPVLIENTLQEGLVVLAGPNKSKDLKYIIQKIKQQRVQIILVDGALNRMIPLVHCDALILTTGASRHIDVDLLVEETESILRVYNLPLREKQKISNQEIRRPQHNMVIFQKNGVIRQLNDHSLISQKTLHNLINNIDEKESAEIYIPGIIQDKLLKEMVEKYSELFRGKTILIDNPTFLLVGSQDICHLKDLLADMIRKGIKLKTLHSLPVLAVTVNPFYPKFHRYGKESYEADWIDVVQLCQKMRSRISLPVINIKGEESKELVMIMEQFLNINKKKK
ncbi:MAG: hypothetical protein PHQ06_05160 [Atribacterota bacterium]|nr:hypothetical protein [Atribacterota bacterium]